MTAVVVSVTLLVFACLAIAWARYCEVRRDVEVAIRNTPPTGRFVTVRLDEPVDDESWGDCPDCGAVIERLTDLFNPTEEGL